MTVTKDEALQRAYNHLHSMMTGRLEIVDRISGCFYGVGKIDVKNSWIIYAQPDELILDGFAQYIIINKQTGSITEVTTS